MSDKWRQPSRQAPLRELRTRDGGPRPDAAPQEWRVCPGWRLRPSGPSGGPGPLLHPGPNGSTCFCIDYKELNKVAKFDAYPMPRTEVLLEQLGTAKFLSPLDLTKGYWKVPVRKEDCPKTAFATPQGLFRKMPFWLHGAAATFQHLVDTVLAQHRSFAATYIDDIIVFSETWQEHLIQLQKVLQALHEARLKVNPSKSHLGFRELKYLSFMVGHGSVHPILDKVVQLQSYPLPRTKKQL